MISRYVTHGEVIRWQDTDIKVLSTPGYARGSVSYIISSDRKIFAFVGDLIYGDGMIMDLYSLQDSLKSIGGYHGYATRIGQLITSLQLILEQKPDFIVPSRGPVIEEPAASVQKLIGRLKLLYSNYLSISAYRWYFPERMTLMTNHIPGLEPLADLMPFSATIKKDPPSWYRHIINSNLVFADDSSAFLIDCGAKEALEEIVKLKQSGRLKRLDGIFITHYHDDHTDLINDVVREFNCPVYITTELKDILENPGAFHLPCLTEGPIPNLSVVESGHTMKWKDFTLTFRFFPGQTLFHDALLFKKQNGEAIFFLGDSFTPSGIDDYCLLNRNLLHDGTGYLYCIDVLKKLPANVLLANQHVEPLFSFSSLQLELMKDLLHERNAIFSELFPWDDINYGVDEQWMSVYPYGQKAAPGQSVGYTVKIFNYSDVKKTFIIEPQKLKGFTAEPAVVSLVVEPHTEGRQEFIINVSQHTMPGVSLQLFNVKFDDWDLREWSEALVEILP
jgi:glyoxylase-like metal-dependent hydrolase (beta-lactamase superfamily II)